MAYFKRDDIPFHWALADAFTVCDGYHCSMLGPTWPNRLYLMTGRSTPRAQRRPGHRNYVPPEGFSWKTYPEMLTKAGVSWKVYQENDNYGMNVLEYFDQYQAAPASSPLYQNAMRFYQAGQFEYDAMHDRLPTVSWILPTSYQSEHPDYMPAAGADYVASKVNAIAANPEVWAKTVFILIYDENDGFFDHVNPPTAPAGTPGEYITVDGVSDPIGLGFRVPCVIVSPWTVGGYVCHDTFDHTSVIRLLEQVTGVVNPNISAWRRQTVGDFTAALGAVPNRRFPRLPATTTGNWNGRRSADPEFALPPIPGAAQSFPVQPPAHRPVRAARPPRLPRRGRERHARRDAFSTSPPQSRGLAVVGAFAIAAAAAAGVLAARGRDPTRAAATMPQPTPAARHGPLRPDPPGRLLLRRPGRRRLRGRRGLGRLQRHQHRQLQGHPDLQRR